MKNLTFILIFLAASFASVAQVDRSKAPEAGPAPKIQIGKSESFTLENGLKVILVENHKRPVISYSLTLDYTPFMEGDVAGNAQIAGSLLRTGTATMKKAEIDEKIDFIGAALSTSSSGIFAQSLTKHTDKLLTIVSDVLLNPRFPEEELERSVKQTLSGLAAAKEEPSAIMANVSSVLKYGADHPYGEIETEETVGNITIESCKEFYSAYYRPNIAYLVIVGDINRAEAEAKAKKYFGAWEKKEVPMAKLPEVKSPEGVNICFVPKTGAVQSVINVTYPIDLKPGAADAIPASVMNSILGGGVFSGRLMQNLREDKAFTYGARSTIDADEHVGHFTAFASVRNDVTDSSVTEFLYELDRLNKEKVDAKDLSLVKNSMNGSFARSLESPQTVARFALNTKRYNLPADYYANYLSRLSQVTIEEVQAMAKKYIDPDNNLVVVVGNKDVAESLKKFDSNNEVAFYDFYGKDADAVERKPAPEGMTASDVYQKYKYAYTLSDNEKGAAKKLKKLKDVTMKGKAEVSFGGQSATLDMVTYKKAPNMFSQSVMFQGAVAQKQTYNGSKGVSINMQTGRKELEGDDLKDMEVQATMNAEFKYAEWGYKTELVGIEPVAGSDAYVIEVTSKEGDTFTEFYDVANGMKVQEISTTEANGQEVSTVQVFGDFKEVKGYMFAHTMVLSGAQSLTIVMDEVKVNSNLQNDLFN